MSQRTVKYTVKKYSVNSTLLADEILQFVDDVISAVGAEWHNEMQRSSVVDVIEHEIEELIEENRVVRYKVICDQRNNKAKAMEQGKFKLSVQYQQRNCVNTTRLEFTITESTKPNEKKENDII